MKYLGKLFICLLIFIAHNTMLKAENLPTAVHIIGDSHAGEFFYIENCILHVFVSKTMNRVGRDGLDFINLKTLGIQENEMVVFAFGEVDVRWHIGKQRDLKGRDLDEIIDTLANNYIRTILANRALYQNLYCAVYSITPSSNGNGGTTPDCPLYGTLEDRVNIARKLNQKLAILCAENGIGMIDVYDDYADENGVLRPELSDHGDGIHISMLHFEPIKNKLLKVYYQFHGFF